MLTIGGITSGGGGNSSFYYPQQKKKENKNKQDQETKNTDNFDKMLDTEISKFKINVLV